MELSSTFHAPPYVWFFWPESHLCLLNVVVKLTFQFRGIANLLAQEEHTGNILAQLYSATPWTDCKLSIVRLVLGTECERTNSVYEICCTRFVPKSSATSSCARWHQKIDSRMVDFERSPCCMKCNFSCIVNCSCINVNVCAKR